MPSGSSVGMPGWDGSLCICDGNAWVPGGTSAWDLSCEKSPRAKAERDYEKRKENSQGEIASQTTFVFIAARRFRGEKARVDNRRQEGHWARVWALGAEDLIAWLEHAPVVAGWFVYKNEKVPETGVGPLDEWWEEWSSATQPQIFPNLVIAGRRVEVDTPK